MNILLNSLVTLSSSISFGNFIIKKVTGLGSADIRTSSFLYSGRSGGMITDQLYGFREISIEGTIESIGQTKAQHKLDRDALLEALQINTVLPVDITTFSGDIYRIDCYVTDVKLEYLTGGCASDYLIQLTASDPLFYNLDGGELQTATVKRTADSGGYITPYILPVEWEMGGAPTSVTNSGNAIVYPTIIIHDTTHDPIVTNLATGELFAVSINTNDGDELVIDMLNRTLKLNGSDIIGNKVANSTWWGLLVGDNPIKLDTDTGVDNGYAEVTWRNGVTGI